MKEVKDKKGIDEEQVNPHKKPQKETLTTVFINHHIQHHNKSNHQSNQQQHQHTRACVQTNTKQTPNCQAMRVILEARFPTHSTVYHVLHLRGRFKPSSESTSTSTSASSSPQPQEQQSPQSPSTRVVASSSSSPSTTSSSSRGEPFPPVPSAARQQATEEAITRITADRKLRTLAKTHQDVVLMRSLPNATQPCRRLLVFTREDIPDIAGCSKESWLRRLKRHFSLDFLQLGDMNAHFEFWNEQLKWLTQQLKAESVQPLMQADRKKTGGGGDGSGSGNGGGGGGGGDSGEWASSETDEQELSTPDTTGLITLVPRALSQPLPSLRPIPSLAVSSPSPSSSLSSSSPSQLLLLPFFNSHQQQQQQQQQFVPSPLFMTHPEMASSPAPLMLPSPAPISTICYLVSR